MKRIERKQSNNATIMPTTFTEFVEEVSSRSKVHAVTVEKESLSQGGLLMVTVYQPPTGTEIETQPTRIEFAGDEWQMSVKTDSSGLGSPFDIPVYIDGDVTVEDGMRHLKQYHRNPEVANVYDLVLSTAE